jgi:hypothetical protein
MKLSIFIRVLVLCLVGMFLAATPWLPSQIGLIIGSGAFVVLVLSMCAFALRVARDRKKRAGGFFAVGIFLLVVAYPSYRAVVSLFEPAQQSAHTEIPGEIVFGVLAVACIIRAWLLWAANEESA